MSKKSLEKWYSELIGNLWNEFMFYIVESELTLSLIDSMDTIKNSDVFNKVFIVDKMLGPIEYKKGYSENVFSKSKMLDDNIYLLLKMKRKLETQEFNFLVDNYFKQVESCFFITNWIHIDLNTNISKEINDALKVILRLQHNSYKEHFGKIIKHFYPNREELPESNSNILETLEEYFPNLLKKKKETNNITVATLPKFKSVLSHKNKKKQLITEKDAETFLLESVFNLKIK